MDQNCAAIITAFTARRDLPPWSPPQALSLRTSGTADHRTEATQSLMNIHGVEECLDQRHQAPTPRHYFVNFPDEDEAIGVALDFRWFRMKCCTCAWTPCACVCLRQQINFICQILGLHAELFEGLVPGPAGDETQQTTPAAAPFSVVLMPKPAMVDYPLIVNQGTCDKCVRCTGIRQFHAVFNMRMEDGSWWPRDDVGGRGGMNPHVNTNS